MYGKLLFVFGFIFLNIKVLYAQDFEVKLQDLVESVADQLPEGADLTAVIDQIQFVQKNPIPINFCTHQDLNSLYFLNALQVQEITSYIQKFGHIMDLAELQTLPSMTIETLRLLQTVTTVESSGNHWKDVFQTVDNNWITRYVTNFKKPLPSYLGDPDRVYQRFQMNASSLVQLNITMEKDHGEYFWNTKNPYRIDFLSSNVVLKPGKVVQNVVLGDYHLQFGQGLVLWTGFAMGITPDITMIAKKPMGLKPYNSATEFNFMRGAAATFSFFKNRLKWTPFFSKQKLDAGLNAEGKITSLPQSGYHRIKNELNNQQKAPQTNAGMVMEWQFKNLQIGGIAQWVDFKNGFVPSNDLHQQQKPLLQTQKNWSVYYQFVFKNMYAYGETALQNQQYWATLNGVLFSLSKNASLSVLYRNYSLAYQAFNSQAIAENSYNANERGFYAGIDFKPSKKLSIHAFGDFFSFPWLRYRVDAPSNGFQFLAQSNFQWKKEHQWLLRYRMGSKALNNNQNSPFNTLANRTSQSIRSQLNLVVFKRLQLENRVEAIQVKNSTESNVGLLVYQDVATKFNRWLSLGLRTSYFSTTSFDSRVYAFENNVLYAFGFNFFHGKGFRNYINIHSKISKHIDVWCRYAQTMYLTQNQHQHEFTVQLRSQF